MSALQITAILGSLASSVAAHGYVSGFVAGGTWYSGYSPSFQYQNPPPTVAGWSDPENLANGYVAPTAYGDADIVCHLSATPGGTAAQIKAGDQVELQWTTWPDSHHGPVLDYLAKVDGEFADIDKTALNFFKIDERGLVDSSAAPGKWASDELIANNNSWAVTIPSSIAPGKYVLRHEIIALHSAGDANGAQNYPQCINLEITSDGTDTPAGQVATSFYKAEDPGIKINIYTTLASYTIPGPALWSAAAPVNQIPAAISSSVPLASSGSAAASSYMPASTTASASSMSIHTSYSNTTYSATAYPSSAPAASTATPEASYTTVAAASSAAYATSEATSTGTPTFYYSDVASSTSAYPTASGTSAASYPSTPTTTPSSDPASGYGQQPEKTLPADWTLTDMQQWVTYLLDQGWNASRKHARDFRA